MAKKLSQQLTERSGLLQYADLSDIPAENVSQETPESPPNNIDLPSLDHELQTEEEPKR